MLISMRLWDDTVDAEAVRVRQLADTLHRRAFWFVGTAVGGLAAVSGIIFWLWRDWKLGYNIHPALYEPVLAAFVGGVIGLGLSMPFGYWFRIQAGLVMVQLRVEENTRMANEEAARTTQTIQALSAGMSGEWPTATVPAAGDSSTRLSPLKD
jgi:hypothetical protein